MQYGPYIKNAIVTSEDIGCIRVALSFLSVKGAAA